jgi:hypothetical protein
MQTGSEAYRPTSKLLQRPVLPEQSAAEQPAKRAHCYILIQQCTHPELSMQSHQSAPLSIKSHQSAPWHTQLCQQMEEAAFTKPDEIIASRELTRTTLMHTAPAIAASIITSHTACIMGCWRAVRPFLQQNPAWACSSRTWGECAN